MSNVKSQCYMTQSFASKCNRHQRCAADSLMEEDDGALAGPLKLPANASRPRPLRLLPASQVKDRRAATGVAAAGDETPCPFPRGCRCADARHAAVYLEALAVRAGALRSDFFFTPSEATSSESAPNWAMT